MNENLQKYLDGELAFEALGAEERAEAERWNALLGGSKPWGEVSAPPWLESRVMASLPARPAKGGLAGVLSWLASPQPIRVRPISLGLIGAAAGLLLFLGRGRLDTVQPGTPDSAMNMRAVAAETAPVVYVQFVFAKPGAATVTVAGDFNAWDVRGTPLTDTDGDGIWTGRVALRPGVHKYMFVVDGEKWVTDPQADSYVDDGFGMRNAVLSVAHPPARTI